MHVRERFENEHVAAAVLEGLELLTECCSRFVETRRTEWLQTNSERANSASNQQIFFRHFARNPCRGAIDLRDLPLESVLRELDAICAKGVRLENFSARFSIR